MAVEAGWYQDPGDPALARWHDGTYWTESTLVVAEQTSGWVPPVAPPDASPQPPPPPPSPPPWETPTATVPAVSPVASPSAQYAGAVVTTDERPWFKKKRWIALAGLLLLLGIGAAAGGDEDEGGNDTTDSTKPEFASLDDAVVIAQAALTTEVSDARVESLIKGLCNAAEDDNARSAALQFTRQPAVETTDDLRMMIEGVGEGAENYCPEAVAAEPNFLRAVYAAGAPLIAPPTTVPTTVATTLPPATTAPPTTQAPRPVVGTQPPATSPPATSPPVSGVFANCTEARNAGAAPVYRGDPGYGSHLDRDNDGIGCE